MSILKRLGGAASLALGLTLHHDASAQILVGQNDAFSATTENWISGGPSPNPPTWISTGGPAGSGDGYLRVSSSGGVGAGSRMVAFNRVQWASNFLPNGIDEISLDANNLGATALSLRLAFSETGGTSFVSATATPLAAGSGWVRLTLPIGEADLTRTSGSKTYAQTLASVFEMRILSSTVPQISGDAIVATLGMDNVTAVPEPATTGVLTALSLGATAIGLRKRRQ